MIVKLCAFLLCCFALYSNIKAMRSSTSDRVPPRLVFVPKPDNDRKSITNQVKTFKKPSTSIISTLERFVPLRASGKTHRKLKRRARLETKARYIKCSFCVIAKYNMSKHFAVAFKRLIEDGVYNRHDIKEITTKLKKETEMIIRLLLAENLPTGKWLWRYYLKIIATEDYDVLTKYFTEGDPFKADQRLQTEVSEFIGNCIRENFLPATAVQLDFVEKNQRAADKIIKVLGKLSFPEHSECTMVHLLYLRPFWTKPLLSGHITGTNVDWSEAERQFHLGVADAETFLNQRSWIYTPYDRSDHQHLLVNIIDARLYCYISVVLHVYGNRRQPSTADDETMLKRKKDLVEQLRDALKLIAYKDKFLMLVMWELMSAKTGDVEGIERISLRVSKRANEILNRLPGYGGFVFKVVEKQLQPSTNNDDSFKEATERFGGFMTELNKLSWPFEYKVILSFLDLGHWSANQYLDKRIVNL